MKAPRSIGFLLLLGLLATASPQASTPPSAYVANGDNSSVSVIDLETRTVLDTLNVGSSPTGMAATPDGSRVYVVNSGSNSVSVIDTATLVVSGTGRICVHGGLHDLCGLPSDAGECL